MAIADRLTLRSVFHTRRFSNGLRFAFPTVYQGWDKADASRARAWVKRLAAALDVHCHSKQ